MSTGQAVSAPNDDRLELIRPDGLRLRIEPGEGIDARAVLQHFLGVG